MSLRRHVLYAVLATTDLVHAIDELLDAAHVDLIAFQLDRPSTSRLSRVFSRRRGLARFAKL